MSIHSICLTLYVLLFTFGSSLRGSNWTTISTNFKPTPGERQAAQDAIMTEHVKNLLDYSFTTSSPIITATTTTTTTTTPTLLLQQRTALLRSGENPTAAANAMSTEEIKRNIAKISVAKGSLSKMMKEVSDSIKKTEAQFKEEREQKLHDLKQAKAVQAAQEVSVDYQLIKATENRVKTRRKAINNCLHMIYGGSNKFYWHMRQVL